MKEEFKKQYNERQFKNARFNQRHSTIVVDATVIILSIIGYLLHGWIFLIPIAFNLIAQHASMHTGAKLKKHHHNKLKELNGIDCKKINTNGAHWWIRSWAEILSFASLLAAFIVSEVYY